MKTFYVEVKGITPLMQHRMTEEEVLGLLGTKSKKKVDKVEETPRELAEKRVYRTQEGVCYIPSEHFVGSFVTASSDWKRADSARKSYKSIAASIFRLNEAASLLRDKKNKELKDYEVDVRSAVNHKAGRVAVCRPRFDEWNANFHVTIDTDVMDEKTAQEIFEKAGRTVGIGSYRVGRGGCYGQYAITEWRQIKE